MYAYVRIHTYIHTYMQHIGSISMHIIQISTIHVSYMYVSVYNIHTYIHTFICMYVCMYVSVSLVCMNVPYVCIKIYVLQTTLQYIYIYAYHHSTHFQTFKHVMVPLFYFIFLQSLYFFLLHVRTRTHVQLQNVSLTN